MAERKNMRGVELGGISIKAAGAGIIRGPSPGGFKGGIDALNATVPMGRISPPAPEGPVSLEGLNNMNILAKPISPKGEIRFKSATGSVERRITDLPRPKPFKAGIQILENPFPVTEPIRAPKAQSLRPRNLPAESFLMLVVARSILPAIAEVKSPLSLVIKPASHLESVASPKTEASLVFSQPTPHAVPVEVDRHEEEEIEEKLETRLISKRMQKKIEEEELEEKEKWTIDEDAQAQRKFDLKHAAKKAKELAIKLGLKVIPSEFIAKFMPSENSKNRSKAVEPEGPDGTYEPIILPTIAKYGQFESEEQAEVVGEKILEDNNPVKKGQEEGKRATKDEVKKVLFGRGIQLGVLEFVTRVVKIRKVRKQTAFVEAKPQEEISVVKTNKDLKEVFKLAA